MRLTEDEFLNIVEFMRKNYGINLEKKKVLIECRLSRTVENCGAGSFGQYMEMLRQDRTGKMTEEMVSRLTTNYTYFLRESVHFSVLEKTVLPELAARNRNGFCNVWCAGCSTGEEAYTLAMLLQDFREKTPAAPSMRILATDISQEVLTKAEQGIYPASQWGNIPREWQKKYCHMVDEKSFQINDKIKYHIRFKKQNLLGTERGAEMFDFIFCRNVMIYFDKESKVKLLRRLEASLKPGGYLFIGLAELFGREETKLRPVCPAVYRKE